MSRLTDAAAEEAASTPRKGPICGVQRIANSFPDEADRGFFLDLVAEAQAGRRTATSITRILARVDVRLPSNVLTYHLRGECSCPKADA